MNALALFWVTDSISERSAGPAHPSATGATMDYPVYEMSLAMSSRNKDPGASVDDRVSVNPRHSRQSWSPFVALDRSFRTLFVREPPPHESGTIDVEVSFLSSIDPCTVTEVGNTDRDPHRDKCRCFYFS